jgi:uncharacterized membrane protein YcaP (DUF421 family)
METFYALIGPENGEASALQMSVRAVLLFVAGIAYLRIAGRRTFSKATPLDIIVAVIIGSNLSRAMTGKAPFIGALVATLVLAVLHRLVAMSSLRWSWLADLVKARPVVLVENGDVDERALKRHGLSQADLAEGLRLEQTASPAEVERATLEANGRISVLPKPRET